MSEYKYKILWLDDDFEPIEGAPNEGEALTRKTFQKDIKKAIEFGIEVVGVSNYEKFCDEIKNIQSYQAVVFDLKGMEMNKENSDMVMPEALKTLNKTYKKPVFVYTANNQSEKFEITLCDLNQKGMVFNKGEGVKPLYERILEVLDANLHYYKGHEECLHLFSKCYLNSENRTRMDELLKMYEVQDRTYAPYNNMRIILEDILDNLVEVGLLDRTLRGAKFNPKMAYLTEKLNYQKDSDGNDILLNGKPQLDYANPVVPFTTCPIEIKYALHYLGDMTNRYSHFLKNNPNYLKRGESVLEYNILIQQSVYSAFFVAMKWYYSYRNSIALDNVPV